jgi:FlaA1/EpsC-like NDP-sugar epimerase
MLPNNFKRDLIDQEILITGGTGSLGKTITKLLLDEHKPRGIRIYSRDEYKQWLMQQEFAEYKNISYLIGDIRDEKRLDRAMKGVDIVFNAAAMKQVPACEYNPEECVKTNVNGSQNILNTAINNKISIVMHISTDKAVYPINIYGACKAVAEKLFIHGNIYSAYRTLFSVCRYGNVLGSRGSIIPLFKKQAKTGTITITDKKMTRFLISLSDVAKFIIDNVCITTGAEIFIPKMPSMKIIDIAKTIASKCRFEEIGIRQGEKLHECLITEEESVFVEEKENMYVIQSTEEEKNKKRWSYTSNTNKNKMTEFELFNKIEKENL